MDTSKVITATARRVTPTISFPTKILVLSTAVINLFKRFIRVSSRHIDLHRQAMRKDRVETEKKRERRRRPLSLANIA
jgi:hypothetical protein